MAISIVTKSDWNMVSPKERGASSSARLFGMTVQEANPHLALLEEPPDHYTQTHSHSEAEIIVILEGRMLVNGQWCEPGTVIHIPANEDYWHSTGAERCVIALMRPLSRARTRRTEEIVADAG